MIQTPILIAAELSSKGEKCSFRPISLFLDQTEALRVKKKFFWTPPPPSYLRVWMTGSPLISKCGSTTAKWVLIIYALCSVHGKFGVWIKAVSKSLQRRNSVPLSRSKSKQAFLIDSDAELFMYLIQCIRFGSWKVRSLNRALISQALLLTKAICFLFSLSCLKTADIKTKIAQIDEFSYGDCSGNLLTSPFLFQKMSLSNPHFVA